MKARETISKVFQNSFKYTFLVITKVKNSERINIRKLRYKFYCEKELKKWELIVFLGNIQIIVKLLFFFRNNLCEILVKISLQPKAKLKELNKN